MLPDVTLVDAPRARIRPSVAGALVLEDAAGQLVAALGLPGTPAAVVTDAHGRVLSTVAAGSAEILAMLPAPANSDPHPLELRT